MVRYFVTISQNIVIKIDFQALYHAIVNVSTNIISGSL